MIRMHAIFSKPASDRFTVDARRVPFWAGLFLSGAICLASVHADDWPGWMGPHRDGVYRESGIVDSLEKDLPVRWRSNLGGGYAGPAVAGDLVVAFDYQLASGTVENNPGRRVNLQGKERVVALNAGNGEIVWERAYACPYSISYPAGPRCTPTIDGNRVYTLGSEGDLKCLNLNDGDEIWSVSLKSDFSASVPIWGFASHPLVHGEWLYTMVGGPGQGVVAFDKVTGEVAWKALDCLAGYCPPSIATIGGVEQLLIYHPAGVVGLDPSDGSEIWSVDIEPMYEMSITRPMIDGDRMYVSGIRTESVMLRIGSSASDIQPLWRGEPKQAVYCANSTPLFVDGVVYGTDCNEGSLIAVDAENGSRLWTTFEATRPEEKRFVKHGTAFLTRLGETDRYLMMSEVGDLVMAQMTRDGFRSLGRQKILEPTGEAFGRSVVWSHPAYAGRTAYARNDREIVAIDLSVR